MPNIFDQLHATKQSAPVPAEYSLLDGAIDVVKGAGKGAANTVMTMGQMAEHVATLGMGKQIRAGLGLSLPLDDPKKEAEIRQQLKPTNTAQRVGHGVEQAAEFLIPGGAVTKGAKLLQAATQGMRGAKALNLGARAGLEAVSAGTVAGVQTKGDAGAMRDAAVTGGVLSGVAGTIVAGAKPLANALRKSAVDQYGRALNPTKPSTKYLAKNQVVNGLLDRGVMARSIEGLETKASQRAAELGQKIDDAWQNLPAGTKVDAEAIFSKLDESITPHTIVNAAGKRVPIAGGQAQSAISNIEDMQTMLLDVAEANPATGKLEVPVDKIRDLRQYWDKYAAKAGKFHGKTMAEESKAEAQGLAANAIRGELAKDHPSIAAINKEFSFWANAHLVAKETADRRVGQSKGLVRRMAGAVAGATGLVASGPVTAIASKAAVDQLERTISSTAWNTVSAVTKDRLAKAIASGNRGAAEFYIRKAFKGSVLSMATTRPAEKPTPELVPVQ